jgi:hypothetical protein
MARFILRPSGPAETDLDQLLPTGTEVVEFGPRGMVLVDGPEQCLRDVFETRTDWLLIETRKMYHASS